MSDTKANVIPWFIAVIAILVAIYFALFNKVAHQYVPPAQVDIPPKLKEISNFSIIFPKNQNDKFFVVDADGNTVAPCKTCNPGLEHKFGPGCKDAPKEMNICGPLKPLVPLGDNVSISIMRLRGSECWLLIPSGDDVIGIPAGCTISR